MARATALAPRCPAPATLTVKPIGPIGICGQRPEPAQPCHWHGRWTSYPLSRTGWLRPRHALASQDEGMELVAMKEGSGLRHRWCAVVWVKENLPLQQHTGDPKQPVGDTA